MAIAVTELITSILQHVSDAGNPGAGNAYLVGLLNKVHAELLVDCRLVVNSVTVVNLTTGTQEYSLDPTAGRIWSVILNLVSGQIGLPLVATNIDELDESYETWRDTSFTAQPAKFYLDGDKIGFWPIPNITTSAGFPNATVYSDNIVTLTGGSSLPAQISEGNADAWVYGALAKHTFAKKRADFPMFQALYLAQKSQLIRLQSGRSVRDKGGPRIRIVAPKAV